MRIKCLLDPTNMGFIASFIIPNLQFNSIYFILCKFMIFYNIIISTWDFILAFSKNTLRSRSLTIRISTLPLHYVMFSPSQCMIPMPAWNNDQVSLSVLFLSFLSFLAYLWGSLIILDCFYIFYKCLRHFFKTTLAFCFKYLFYIVFIFYLFF